MGVDTRRIGLALGGGGVRGLAHILVLELLDEFHLKPCVISGTSMGAVVGALYASGMPAREIHGLVTKLFIPEDRHLREVIKKRVDLLRWVGPPVQGFGHGGILRPDRFLKHLLDKVTRNHFEDLDIPLLIFATDFWSAQEVVFETGELLPAIRASIAVPGVFAPLLHEGHVLVDGGLVNNVPYVRIRNMCDVLIAVDVGRSTIPGRRELPGALEAILGAFDIMQAADLARKMESCKPDILVQPQVGDIRIYDFAKAEEILERARPAIEDLRTRLTELGLCDRPAL